MRVNKFCKALALLILCLIGVASPGNAQTGSVTVKGKVLDDKSGEPLIGVGIHIVGTTQATFTDLDGSFQLAAPENSVLLFSYMGYKRLEIPASSAKTMAVFTMTEDADVLDEVVVVGYGTQKKATSVGSVTQTTGESLLRGGALNSVTEALQGKLNGVVTINSSGQPGANTVTMYIRGKSSWDTTDPLVLLDGVQSDIKDVDMNEIESISVLKDASATAVYGVRGGNGVILITTKRGENAAPKVSFTMNTSVKAPTTKYSIADHSDAMNAYNRALANDQSWDKIIPRSTLVAWEKAYESGNVGPYSDMFPYINWWDETVGTGTTQNYNVNIRGGSEFMTYFASIGVQDDKDIYKFYENKNFDPNHRYKRYNWRSNFDFNLTKSTKLSISVAGKMAYRNSTNNAVNILGNVYSSPTSNYPIKYSDGEWGDDTYYNVIANMNEMGSDLNKTFQSWYDVQLDQKLDFITKGLKANIKVSYNTASTTSTETYRGNQGHSQAFRYVIRYNRLFDYSSPQEGPDGSITYPMTANNRLPYSTSVVWPVLVGTYDSFSAYSRRFYYEFSLGYDRYFNDHHVSALALLNRQIVDSKSGGNMVFPSFNEDWVGRVTYNWKERYLAEFNISYTGSEKFARGQRFGLFPSFSGGWRFSEEPFIKQRFGEILTSGKIRYSWGKVGTDFGASRWNYIQQFTSGGSLKLGTDANGQSWGPMYSEGDIANIHSTWEKSVKQNIGLELGFFRKLTIALDLFDEQRKDILMTPQTTSSITGATFNEVNLGRTKNHGYEFELRWDDNISKDLHYYVKFTMAASENRVVFRDDPAKTYNHLKAAGKPIGYSTRYLVLGNYETIDDVFNYAQSGAINSVTASQVVPGDYVYADFNSDGTLNADDKVAVNQLSYPLCTYGLDFGFEWKNFGFNALLYAPVGIWKQPSSIYWSSFEGGYINAQEDALSRWTPATANITGIQKAALHLGDSSKFNGTDNTYRYQNFSYLRLKNIEVSYSMPKKWLRAVKMSSASVYVNGNNLLTFWKGDKRIDPEGNQGGYPMLRTVTGGLRFSF